METHAEKKCTFDAGARLRAGREGYTVQNPGATGARKLPFDAATLQVEKKYTFGAGAQLMTGSRVTKQKPGTTRKYPFDAVKCRSMMETQVKKKYTFDAGAQLLASG